MESLGPSSAETKQRIDDFLTQLSAWDLVHLRQRLRQRVIRLRSLQDLPSELICIITIDHLDANHTFRLTRVCRAWRAAVQRPDVSQNLCRAHFPGLLEMSKCGTGDEFFLFQNAYMNLRKKYQKTTPNLFSLQRWFVDGEQNVFEDRQVNTVYSSGKVAWQPNESFFMFQNLITADDFRKVHLAGSVVSGRKLDLLTMSDQLIVLTSVDATKPHLPCRQLKIWCIKSNDFKSISLPGPLAKCYASRDHVYIATLTGQIFSWTWDKRLKEIIASKEGLAAQPTNYSAWLQGIPGVITHPVNPDTVYLAWVYVSDTMSSKCQHSVKNKSDDGNSAHGSLSSDRHDTSYCNSSYKPSFYTDSENEADSFYSSSTGSDCGGDSRALPSGQDEGYEGAPSTLRHRMRCRMRGLEVTSSPSRFKIIVVKYHDGNAMDRMEYDMPNIGGTCVSSTKARYERVSVHFQMLCQTLDAYGSSLIGVTCRSFRGTRYAPARDSWEGIRFNVFSSKFTALEYVPVMRRGFTRQPHSRGASFAAQDLSLIVVGGPVYSERPYSCSTMIFYAENAARKLGMLHYKKKTAADMDQEPEALLGAAQDIEYDRDDLKIFMDSVGTLVPTSKFLLFSYNGNGYSEIATTVTAKVVKTTVPHAWLAAQRRNKAKERPMSERDLHEDRGTLTSDHTDVDFWRWGQVRGRRNYRRDPRSHAVPTTRESDDESDGARDMEERAKRGELKVTTGCWNVPYAQLRREFCPSQENDNAYNRMCATFRWRGGRLVDEPPVPPELEPAEAEIEVLVPRQ